MKVLYCGVGWLPLVDVLARELTECEVAIWDRAVPLAHAAAEVDVILPSSAAVDADVIAAARRLRLIQQPASGVDTIDVEAARRAGVPVCNAPAANDQAVAEAALFLMLALARRLREAAVEFARSRIGEPVGIELAGKTLGIIGRGRAGGRLAAIAESLGMAVVSVNSQSSRDDLEALFAASHVISIHCPLTPATRHLIDDAAFARFKPGALLVNCARGPIVERGALERALARGQLGGVGLDVYWEEPWDPSDPLFSHHKVVTMPHTAGSTQESFARIADIVCENVRRVARGDVPLHQVR